MSSPAGKVLHGARRFGRGLLAPVSGTRSHPGRPRVHVVIVVDTEGDFRGARADSPTPRPSLRAFTRRGEVGRACRESWRARHRDAAGDPPRLTWFVRFDRQVEAAGQRDLIFQRLHEAGDRALVRLGDEVAWHHHHMRWEERTGRWLFDSDYRTNRDHEAALAAFVAATGTFPSAFRSGALMETPDLHAWLQRYIPFDYSLPVGPLPRRRRHDPELGVTMDWSAAPNDWSYYRPRDDDYQQVGGNGRVIFPTTGDFRRIAAAFARAEQEPVVLGIALHDYDAITDRLFAFFRRLAECSRGAGIGYRFATASDAARRALRLDGRPPGLRFRRTSGRLFVTASARLFGPAPYVAAGEGGLLRPLPITPAGTGTWEVGPGPTAHTVYAGAASLSGKGEAVVCRLQAAAARP